MLQERSCNKNTLKYKVKVSSFALGQLDRTLGYVLFTLRNEQAVKSILDVFWETVESMWIILAMQGEIIKI